MTDLVKEQVDAETLWTSLGDLLRANLGLHYSRDRLVDLKRGITAAAAAFDLNNAEECARWLLSAPMSPEQIGIVASCLTVGETYFFRDPRSFEIFSEEILLHILQARQGVNQHLRIWSAACCSGEEPYSIAMMLTKVIPMLQDWRITLLATDIDPKFLKKARDGVYSHWSFRGMPQETMESFFSELKPGHFAIAPKIKNMVTFATLNLVKEEYPAIVNRHDAMDIIFCRNVLMYFERSQAYKVLQKLSQTLVEGGWLFLSPCDAPPNMELLQLKAVKFGDYTIYQKDSTNYAQHNVAVEDLSLKSRDLTLSSPITQSLPVAAKPYITILDKVEVGAKPIEKTTQTILQEANLLLTHGSHDQAIKTVKCCLEKHPVAVELMIFLAEIHANLGQLSEARTWCEQALELDPVNAACCYLYATILQEQGLDVDAAAVLRRVLYLDQNNPVVYFSLGNFYRHQGNPQEAIRHYQNALDLLKGYALDEDVMGSDGMSVQRLTESIQAAMDVGESR